MGCDGGTIPRRDELVRTKKKPEQKDKESEMQFRWRHCALTQQPLQEPVVMCGLGRLYSKQSVIENLLEKDKMPEAANHIKSLKDIKQLTLTPNPTYTDADKQEGLLDVRSAPYICKLIGLEMSGKFRFIALWACGCVFSERALKEIKSSVCSLCQTPFTEADVVILNGSDEDIEHMRVKMEARVARRKAEKKEKSDKKAKKIPEATEAGPSTSKVEEAKPGSSKIVKELKRSNDEKLTDPAFLKAKKSYSVATDPKASDVYKSIFTSHQSEKEQERAHWVTYNPFYN
ncbi:replication termination factor 2 [Phlebotomus argentipes]|uniref:replication termination factor 2 n=1 Tax=Phlebotomus argentipes TaxID=94469 RepID=UPI002892D532|nr:replication termination factor 2 [Phlebotomus argentipes]